ncbi:MAG: hypothetical protein ACI3V0_04230 [Faecousia sp.]
MNKQDNESPKAVNGMEELKRRDDALFEALGKSKKKKRRKLIGTIAIILLVLAIVLVAGVSILQRQVRQRFATSNTDVLSEVVETGTISTLVSGSGILSNVDAEALTIPDGVELTEILVENGDTVEAGQLLATADMSTVRSALVKLHSEIEDLDGQIYDADDDEASTRITAGVPGRVKILYAATGDNVSDIMVENGALAVLSLDGYMALDLETTSLQENEKVTVRLAGGEEHTGSVESLINGVATILVTDDGPENGETATVFAADGTEVGSAELYIHSPLMVTGFAGSVRTVHSKLNAKVSKNTVLFTLKDTGFSAAYDTLLRNRKDAEETLLELLNIQKFGGMTAPVSGSIFSVVTLDDLEEDETITDLLTLSPDVSMSVTISVDESDILSLELGQEASVTVGSVTEDVLTGIVTEIDKTAADGSYTAVITLDKLDGMLPGMSADVDVRIQGVENALLVPADAVHYTSTGAYVYTSYDEETQEYGGRVDVVTGLSNDNYVEITSGLKAGDTVYYTESKEFFFGGMGNMGGGMSPMGNMGGAPSGSFGSNDRGNRPQGGMPSGAPGSMPGGRG